jgi:hypothetical protein
MLNRIDEVREYINNQEYLLVEEMPLAALLAIYDRLGEVLESLEMQGSDVSPVGPGGTAPYPIGVKRDSLREAL